MSISPSGQPTTPTMDVPSPESAADAPPKRQKPSIAKRILILAIVVVVGIGASVGTWMLLTEADRAATAQSGYEHSTDAYAVSFPGEPETGSQQVPGTEMSLQIAQWQNKQKLYVVAHTPTPMATSLQDSLAGTLQASGATLVNSEEVRIDGGTALLAQSTVEGETLWTMLVFSDDGDFFTLSHSGDEKDGAFFASFRIL